MQKDKAYTTENYRFYGRRQGHALSPARKKLLSDLLPGLLIDLEPSSFHERTIRIQRSIDVLMSNQKLKNWVSKGNEDRV